MVSSGAYAAGRKSRFSLNTCVDPSCVNRYVDAVKSGEAKRYLQKLGATFEPGKGGHLKVTLNGRRSILPMHGNKELKTGTWRAIQKQLGLKEKD
jgi:mRNA interferase HicA